MEGAPNETVIVLQMKLLTWIQISKETALFCANILRKGMNPNFLIQAVSKP